MTAPVPGPRFRDQLAEAEEPTREDRAVAAGLVRRARAVKSDDERDVVVDAVAREIASERAAANQRAVEFHRAENAEERGEGICRTCLAPIWNEGGTVGHIKRTEGWSDRIERGGGTVVCFKAIDYRHVPLAGREAAIYDRAAAAAGPTEPILAAEPTVKRVERAVASLYDIAKVIEHEVRDAEPSQYKANELGKAMGYRRSANDLRRALDGTQ